MRIADFLPMGCCLSCCLKSSKDKKLSEMSEIGSDSCEQISANLCKLGLRGKDVKQINSEDGIGLEGTGTAVGSCPIECDSGYFEVVIGDKNPSDVLVGVKRYNPKKNPNLDKQLSEQDPDFPSWYFSGKILEPGDVVGIYWDQTDSPALEFSVNGVEYPNASVNRIRPSTNIYAAVSLNNSSCTIIFNEKNFRYKPKARKYSMIICASALI